MARRRKPIPKYKQGVFKPRNPKKCLNCAKGDPIEYRSQLEFEYMTILDRSDKVKSWGSEVLWIPYMHPIKKRVCQYWTDFIVDTVDHGVLVIEIKPAKEIKAIFENKMPKATKRKKQSTLIYETRLFLINKAKWTTAKSFCENKGYKFIQLSEEHLKNRQLPF